MKGTTPEGITGERQAARWVQAMFARVAPRYDLANHLLSFQVDRWWRRRTVGRVSAILQRPDARVLDLCCGTGDLLLGLQAECPAAVLGSDFCHPMLTAARRKIAGRRFPCELFEADALRLPVRDASLDLITMAFGFRNLANYETGLREFRRVLRAGGMLAILEFSQPPNAAFAALYHFYARRILPVVGGLISGSRGAYEYLPESVRKFPSADGLLDLMRQAGLREVAYERMTGGIVALHRGRV